MDGLSHNGVEERSLAYSVAGRMLFGLSLMQ